MPKLLFGVMIICLLTACTPPGEPTHPAAGSETPLAAPDPASTFTAPVDTTAPTSQPTAEDTVHGIQTSETPVVVTEQGSDAEYRSGDLWLRLESPRDEAEVNEPDIRVTGQAPAETVISVNEEILLVGEDERFTLPIRLEEGPNVIELVASSPQGDLIELVLTVNYEKE